MNFKKYILFLEEILVDVTPEEHKLLTYTINMLLRKRNQYKALPKSNRFKTERQRAKSNMYHNTDVEDQSTANFRRLFKFDPNVDEKTQKHIGWFFYDLMQPRESILKDEDKDKIEKILNKSLLKYSTGVGRRIDFKQLFEELEDGELYDKGFRVLAIMFHALAKKYAEEGHTAWEKYVFNKSLKPDTRKHFGDIFGELDK